MSELSHPYGGYTSETSATRGVAGSLALHSRRPAAWNRHPNAASRTRVLAALDRALARKPAAEEGARGDLRCRPRKPQPTCGLDRGGAGVRRWRRAESPKRRRPMGILRIVSTSGGRHGARWMARARSTKRHLDPSMPASSRALHSAGWGPDDDSRPHALRPRGSSWLSSPAIRMGGGRSAQPSRFGRCGAGLRARLWASRPASNPSPDGRVAQPHSDPLLSRGLFVAFCREYRLPPPETNKIVLGLEVDALWPQHRLIVELDGFAFHRHRAAFERDRARDAALVAAEYRVLRLTYRRLQDQPAAVAGQLRRLLGVSEANHP